MNRSAVRIVIGALMLVALTASAAAAQATLYAARNAQDAPSSFRGAASLYTLDPSTGVPTLVGPIGFDDVFTMDVHPLTGTLYAVGRRPIDRVVVLITINTTTGAGTEVAAIDLPGGDLPIGIAFRQADGALFAVFRNVLQPVNLDGGPGSGVGIIGFTGQQGALELSPDDFVYSTDAEAGVVWKRFADVPDPLAGSFFQAFTSTEACRIDDRFCLFGSLSFHPATGELYALMNRRIFDAMRDVISDDDYVVVLDPVAGEPDEFGNRPGAVTILGNALPAGFNALAWSAAGPNTPIGTNITVVVAPATLSFATVEQPGTTTVTSDNVGPPVPSGFALGTPATYFEIQTTAVFTGAVQVCIDYSGIAFTSEASLRLMHFENTAFVDVTTSLDTTSNIICGSVTSLSPFALFEPTTSPAQLIVNLIELLKQRQLPAALEARLVAALEAALVDPRKVSLTCSLLNRFITLVHVAAAQGFIPAARATELISSARAIRVALGC